MTHDHGHAAHATCYYYEYYYSITSIHLQHVRRGKQLAERTLQRLGMVRTQRRHVEKEDELLARELHPLQLELAPPRMHRVAGWGARGCRLVISKQ